MLGLEVSWAYKKDPGLRLPFQENLSEPIQEPSFKQPAGEAIFSKARVITNYAVHIHRPVPEDDPLVGMYEVFYIAYGFTHTCARLARPEPGLTWMHPPCRNPRKLPRKKRSSS